ncbi:MAG: hypothetical protein K1X47_17005 [Cyclobacteriaceae bacterium]|nr:hypothetical protein [Cyclobacteriaceae bacterium]
MIRRPGLTTSQFWNTLFAFLLTGAAFSVFFQQSPGGCGDYPQNFEVLYLGLGAGAFLFVIYWLLWRLIPHAGWALPVLDVTIRFYLASVILGYGFAKVFVSQFPHLMANMDARFTELSPMRVAWAFFGYSRGYQMFLGWGEVIPALLLLFRRTSLLGALLMLVVMLNVFLINIFFDVCVKLNSGLYTVLSLFILLQHTPRLWNFFIANRMTPPTMADVWAGPRWVLWTGRVVKYAALAWILWTNGQAAVNMMQYAQSHVAQTPVQGAWRAFEVRRQQDSVWTAMDPNDSLYAGKIFFDGYNGVIRSEWIRDRFRFSLDSASSSLTVNFTNARNEWNIAPEQWVYQVVAADTLSLTTVWRGSTIAVKAVRRKEKLTRY